MPSPAIPSQIWPQQCNEPATCRTPIALIWRMRAVATLRQRIARDSTVREPAVKGASRKQRQLTIVESCLSQRAQVTSSGNGTFPNSTSAAAAVTGTGTAAPVPVSSFLSVPPSSPSPIVSSGLPLSTIPQLPQPSDSSLPTGLPPSSGASGDGSGNPPFPTGTPQISPPVIASTGISPSESGALPPLPVSSALPPSPSFSSESSSPLSPTGGPLNGSGPLTTFPVLTPPPPGPTASSGNAPFPVSPGAPPSGASPVPPFPVSSPPAALPSPSSGNVPFPVPSGAPANGPSASPPFPIPSSVPAAGPTGTTHVWPSGIPGSAPLTTSLPLFTGSGAVSVSIGPAVLSTSTASNGLPNGPVGTAPLSRAQGQAASTGVAAPPMVAPPPPMASPSPFGPSNSTMITLVSSTMTSGAMGSGPTGRPGKRAKVAGENCKHKKRGQA